MPAEAAWNMKLVSNTPPSEKFVGVTNSDLAFTGKYAIQGNYNGYQVWDISNPATADAGAGISVPRLAERRLGLQEPALRLGRSADRASRLRHAGRARAGQQGAAARHPHLRRRRHGAPEVRRQRADLPRLAHPHRGDRSEGPAPTSTSTCPDPPACARPTSSPAASTPRSRTRTRRKFRIEVIKVPLAAPEKAAIVSSPRIFNDLPVPPRHADPPGTGRAGGGRRGCA